MGFDTLLRRGVLLILSALVSLCLFSGTLTAEAISAGAAVLLEPETGTILFERNAHTPRSMASTTKIMTALLALETLPHDMEITVADEAVLVEGSALGLRGGDKISLLDLVTGMMLASGNDAANAVAYAVSGGLPDFALLMNRKAAELGMKNSGFVTPSGLDADGHMSTAYDMALLAAAAMENSAFAEIAGMSTAVIRFGNPPRNVTVTNHNKLLKLYEPAVGIKTGFTKKAGRCLVSAAEKDGIRLIAVTLNAPDDWDDHQELYGSGFAQVRRVQLRPPELPALTVSGGMEAVVTLNTAQPPQCVVAGSGEPEIKTDIRLPGFVLAPVESGAVVGSVTYTSGDRILFTGEITTADSIAACPRAGYWKRVGQWLGILIRSMY